MTHFDYREASYPVMIHGFPGAVAGNPALNLRLDQYPLTLVGPNEPLYDYMQRAPNRPPARRPRAAPIDQHVRRALNFDHCVEPDDDTTVDMSDLSL
jgi:hypothetical protein